MAYSFLGHIEAAASGSGGVTTGAAGASISTADLIVLAVEWFTSGTGLTVGDSLGNTYSTCTEYDGTIAGGSANSLRFYYCHGPSVNSSMTFHATGTSVFSPIGAMWFSGSAASPLDQQNGNVNLGQTSGGGAGPTSGSPGSITPSQANELVVFAIGGQLTTISLTSGGTLVDHSDYSGGVTWGLATGYAIQTTATAINPVWAFVQGAPTGNACNTEANIASFKAAAGFTAVNRRTLGPRVGSRSVY